MARKIRILALAALVSVMICPAQAADPSTPAQVTDDPASSESSIGGSIGGFFKKIGEGISKGVKDAVNRDPYAERTVIARGNVPGGGWAYCYKDDPTPDFDANIRAHQETLRTGVGGGKFVITPFTCDNLIKSGVMKRVATAGGSGPGAHGSADANGASVGSRRCLFETLIPGRENQFYCRDRFTNAVVGKSIYYYDGNGVPQNKVIDGSLVNGKFKPGKPGAESNSLPGLGASSQADPEAFENIARDANKEILRRDAEDRAKMAADESEHKRQSLQNQKEGMAKMDATLKKELERIHQMDKTMRTKGAASPQSQ